MTQQEWENLASLLSLAVGLLATAALLLRFVPDALIKTLERQFARLAKRPRLCGTILAGLSLSLCGVMTWHKGIPQPWVHDESSYLLAADTFAHGRITNPTPLYDSHFETPQQLMRPTYMSKYPPGQGIGLAIGQVLTGQPIVGAWLCTAGAVLAIYWMLLGFTSPSWSLLGGVVAALQPQLLDWAQLYWGGSLTVIGSALVLGAWGRLMIKPLARASLLFGSGLVILANTRPFEGFVFSLPFMIALLWRYRLRSLRIAMIAGMIVMPAAVAMGYYNYRITGRVLWLPFFEYSAQYEWYPKFWFLPPGQPRVSPNPTMQYVNGEFERIAYESFHSFHGAIYQSLDHLNTLFTATVCFAVLFPPLIAGLFFVRMPRLRCVKISILVLLLALWTEIVFYPHYLAPMLPAVLLVMILGWRKLSTMHFRRLPLGRTVARATLIGVIAGAALVVAQPAMHGPLQLYQKLIIDKLPPLQTGRHLIFISYGPMHSYESELVHNLSDMDQSRIIWARSMGRPADEPLANHYADRQVWTLHIGGSLELKPFSDHSGTQMGTTRPW